MLQAPSFYDRRFEMGGLMSQVDVTTESDALVRPGQHTILLDFLDQKWVDLLDSIQFWVPVTYTGQKITTICYNVQNITSAWLITLAFNGLAHPMQLQPGMVLRVPTLQELNRVLLLLNSVAPTRTTITI